MEPKSYTEKHVHAISVVDADPAILSRESAIRRILHALQENAIDCGNGRGTTHLPTGRSLVDVGMCKRANAFRAIVRLRDSGWIRDATVCTKLGGRTRGFLIALHESAGLGQGFVSPKIQDGPDLVSPKIQEVAGFVSPKIQELGAENGAFADDRAVQGRSKVGPIRVQGRSNVESKVGPIRVQGRSNVAEVDVAPERRKPKSQTSIQIKNTKYVLTDGEQVSLGLDSPKPRKPAPSAKAKVSPQPTRGKKHQDYLRCLADEVFEHEQRRYREHRRCGADDPGIVRDKAEIENGLEHLGDLCGAELSGPDTHLSLARSIIEFRWEGAHGVGESADNQWSYWYSMWKTASVERVYGYLQEPQNVKYIYWGMRPTRGEVVEDRFEIVAEHRNLGIGSSAVLEEGYGIR